MNGQYGAGRPGSQHRFGLAADAPGFDLWSAVDELRGMFAQRGPGTRMGRGDVRAAILALLAERPMHGYQIIQEIDERSNGTWKPSPGSVYPTLQLLADEGLVTTDVADGKKTYALTDAGQQEAAAADRSAPWEAPAARDGGRVSDLPKAGASLAQAVAQLARTGTPDQVQRAVAILDEARRKVYAILAEE